MYFRRQFSKKRTYLSSRKNRIKSKQSEKINIEFSLPLSKNKNTLIIVILTLLSAVFSYYYIHHSFLTNKEYCFPLDDSWIHLTFARNLIEFGSYSYFKNEMVTAGSTSPIYTLILALGYIFIKNEYLLSFIIGIIFCSLTTLTICLLRKEIFSENWLGMIAAFLFALDRWINFFADSGMETPLYIFLIVITYYFYLKRSASLFGLTLGLSLWARPDAIAFIFVIIADYFIFLQMKKKCPADNKDLMGFSKAELTRSSILFGLVLILYVGMNLMLSGTILPNTFSAKTVYYAPEFRSRTGFLEFEVWGYFTSSSYVLIIVPFILGFMKIFYDSFKLKHNSLLPACLFIFALIFLYWYKLPFAAVKGRYLVPIIPFYIIVSVYGAREFFKILARYLNDKKLINALNLIFFIILIVYSAISYSNHKNDYAEQTHHISIRNLSAAKWINENTSENSVIATHDIGAIGYYTKRRIVDVAGLVSPIFTPKLFDPYYSRFMIEEMKRENVSYVAFIREWYQIVNQTPLFMGGDNNAEILEIYKFEPEKTHVLSREVNGALQMSIGLLANKQPQQARTVLSRMAVADPLSSLTFYLLGYTNMVLGDLPDGEKNLLRSLDIFPGYRDATFLLADLYKRENNMDDARKFTSEYLKLNPSDTSAVKLLKSLSDSTQKR